MFYFLSLIVSTVSNYSHFKNLKICNSSEVHNVQIYQWHTFQTSELHKFSVAPFQNFQSQICKYQHINFHFFKMHISSKLHISTFKFFKMPNLKIRQSQMSQVWTSNILSILKCHVITFCPRRVTYEASNRRVGLARRVQTCPLQTAVESDVES